MKSDFEHRDIAEVLYEAHAMLWEAAAPSGVNRLPMQALLQARYPHSYRSIYYYLRVLRAIEPQGYAAKGSIIWRVHRDVSFDAASIALVRAVIMHDQHKRRSRADRDRRWARNCNFFLKILRKRIEQTEGFLSIEGLVEELGLSYHVVRILSNLGYVKVVGFEGHIRRWWAHPSVEVGPDDVSISRKRRAKKGSV